MHVHDLGVGWGLIVWVNRIEWIGGEGKGSVLKI